MDKVLFIGKFNESTKSIQKYLKDHISVQMCSDNPDIVKSMVQMYKPDTILINLNELDEKNKPLLRYVTEIDLKTSVLVVGTEAECQLFSVELLSSKFEILKHPISNDKILDKINEVLSNKTKPGKEVEAKQDDRKTILVVDDSPVMLRSLKKMLEDQYRITMATSGEQAMQIIDKDMPNLVILDYEMPVCDGRQTLEMIRDREDAVDLPVIFLTGHGDAKHIKSVLALNPAAYFLKPPMPDKLLATISDLI